MDEHRQPIELLLAVDRDDDLTLGAQIESQLRQAIREGTLRPDTRIPSTRDLASQLGISRRVVVDAYAQLAAEGYLAMRQGARPRVASAARPDAPDQVPHEASAPLPLYDFRPSLPDVATFPRTDWLRSMRDAIGSITDLDLSYGDTSGVHELRVALADYLGRVRGVVADPASIVVTSGYTQGLGIVCQALAARGAQRVGLEDPGDPDARAIVLRAGMQAVPVPVDEHGLMVDELARAGVDAVIVTPAHHHPTGVVLSGDRRRQLLAWLTDSDAIAIEDDYDAEYRYDRAAIGALQGLDPEHIVYAGTASKTLAPALRLGWLAVPRRLFDGVAEGKLLADRGSARIEQVAFADFLTRGALDRHLRRMRIRYRARRDVLVDAVAAALPEARVLGIAAGLHATVELPAVHDERAIAAAAQRRRVRLETLGDYRLSDRRLPPTLLLGYGRMPEPAIEAAVREIAAAVQEVAGARPGDG